MSVDSSSSSFTRKGIETPMALCRVMLVDVTHEAHDLVLGLAWVVLEKGHDVALAHDIPAKRPFRSPSNEALSAFAV